MEQTAVTIFIMLCIFFPSVIIFLDDKLEGKVRYIKKVEYIYVDRKDNKHASSKSKSKPKPKVEHREESSIKKDAFDCLISLGMKTKDANQKIDRMFATKNYQTIESFLLDAYKIT